MEEASPQSDDQEALPSGFWKMHQNFENVINSHSTEESEEYCSPFESCESDFMDEIHFSSNPSTPSLSPVTSPTYHSSNEVISSCPNLFQQQDSNFPLPIIPQQSNQTGIEPSTVGPVRITAIYKPDFGYLIDPKTKRPAKQLCHHCNKWISPKKGKKHIIMDRSINCCQEYDYCSHCTIRANKWKGKITVLYNHASSVPIDFIFVDTKAGCDHRIQCEKCGQHKFCFSSHTCKKKEHNEFQSTAHKTHEFQQNVRTKSESAPSLFSHVNNPQKNIFHNPNHWNQNHQSNLAHLHNTLLPHASNEGSNHIDNTSIPNLYAFNALNGALKICPSQSSPALLTEQHPHIFHVNNHFNLESNDFKNLSHQIDDFSSKMLNSNYQLKLQLQSQCPDQNKKLTPSEEMLYEVWSTEFGSKEKIDENLLNQLLRKIHTCFDPKCIPTLASWKSFTIAKIVVNTDNHLHFKTFEEWFGRLGPSTPENHTTLWCWAFFLERVDIPFFC